MSSLLVTLQFQKCVALFTLDYLSQSVSAKSVITHYSARQIFKGYFHSLLQILKNNFHAQSGHWNSGSLKGQFEVLVHDYAQIRVWGSPDLV